MQRRNRKFTPEELAILFPKPPQPPMPYPKADAAPPPSMVVALMGGLGNQMFQYAFGISVAAARHEDVGFTIHRLRNDRFRPMGYQLDGLVEDIKIVPNTAEQQGGAWFTDQGEFFAYQPNVYTVDLPKTFVGYWQTEKYFNVELVRRKITFRYPLSEQSLKVAEQIDKAGKGSAFLHIRRGADYRRNAVHKIMPLDYYREAIFRIHENHTDAKYFLFGDDPEWMRAMFVGPEFTIVDHIKPDTNAIHEDMHLMSLCQNGAIANSSFSWWAAWLGDPKNEKMIFAPSAWFGTIGEAMADIRDLMPARWTKLEIK